jgi:hypothetical protein
MAGTSPAMTGYFIASHGDLADLYPGFAAHWIDTGASPRKIPPRRPRLC